MTIAAGFAYQDGVLLCSDTQMESGTAKTHAPKIGHFPFAGGNVGMAFAGNASSAVSTIQKCAKIIGKIKAHEDVIAEIESVLDTQYDRLVYRHPKYGRDDDYPLHFWLIFSVWLDADQQTYLFGTDENKVTAIPAPGYRCEGIGRDLGNYILGPMFPDFAHLFTEERAKALAAYMIARLKDSVPGVGGISQFVAMRNDGSSSIEAKPILDELERVARSYDAEAHRLLFSMAGDDDQEFLDALKGFGVLAEGMRRYWKAVKAMPSSAEYLQSSAGGKKSAPPLLE